jgi:hypothetical protein
VHALGPLTERQARVCQGIRDNDEFMQTRLIALLEQRVGPLLRLKGCRRRAGEDGGDTVITSPAQRYHCPVSRPDE